MARPLPLVDAAPGATLFYLPSADQLAALAGPWCASYSGGKDSTAMVTWLEWLRRSGRLQADRPRLVRSDTGVEGPALDATARALTALLAASGWECGLVRPELRERLYNRILGIGNTPVHPGVKNLRWCTRATKIDPMGRWSRENGGGLQLTGLRLGESKMRDGKIARAACAAGGECGIPDPGEGTFSPILHWSTCQVVDWLEGHLAREVREAMADVFAVTRQLAAVYGFTSAATLFEEREVTSSARFGCVGCPAISAERAAPRSAERRNGVGSPLNELYDVWFEARLPQNRLVNLKRGKRRLPGPIRLEARKRLFARVMDIQARAGVVLVTPEDEAFIRDCWERKVYPRGWSEADEATEAPEPPLFRKGT